jgi:DnaJ-domain-containing protein 1
VRLPYLTIGSRTNLLFFFVHQEHLIALHLPVRNTIDTVKDVSYAFHYSSKRTGRFKTMLQQADEEQLDALDGRRKIKGLCETRWSSRADALNIFK